MSGRGEGGMGAWFSVLVPQAKSVPTTLNCRIFTFNCSQQAFIVGWSNDGGEGWLGLRKKVTAYNKFGNRKECRRFGFLNARRKAPHAVWLVTHRGRGPAGITTMLATLLSGVCLCAGLPIIKLWSRISRGYGF